MTASEIDAYQQRLLALGQRHNSAVSRLQGEAMHGLGGESGGGLSNTPTHLADLGNAHHEEEVGLILMENEEYLLSESNAALARIRAGTFGLCEKCFQEIPRGRLDAVPYARRCLTCSQVREGGFWG
jgi:RNA polymerase-binding transcription factor DksA